MRRLQLILPILLLCSFMYPDEEQKTKPDYEFSLTNLRSAKAPYVTNLICEENSAKTNFSYQRGVVFTCRAVKAGNVKIAGDFSKWRRIDMKKGKYGVWYYFLGEYDKRETVRYKFVIDGIWTEDPQNYDRDDDGSGSYVSKTSAAFTGENKFVTYRIIKENGVRMIEFRTYNSKASFISVVGDFNRWNPDNDIMTKDSSNIWRIKKQLPKGSYRYTFIVDGEWTSDKFNPDNSSDPTGKLCSLVKMN